MPLNHLKGKIVAQNSKTAELNIGSFRVYENGRIVQTAYPVCRNINEAMFVDTGNMNAEEVSAWIRRVANGN